MMIYRECAKVYRLVCEAQEYLGIVIEDRELACANDSTLLHPSVVARR